MVERGLEQFGYQVTGGDAHVKSRASRLAQTPRKDVIWSGNDGVSKCYPIDPASKQVLQKYGLTYIRYDRTGEPDFSAVSDATVKISDMGFDRQKNFSSAGKKMLGSPWAEERGIKTLTQLDEYRKRQGLTWHECSDGVTMQLVPREINARFGHSGGVSEMAAMDTPINIGEEGVLRSSGKLAGKASIRLRQSAVWVGERVNTGLMGEFTAGAADALSTAAISLVICGTQNLVRVASGEIELEEAVKDMAKLGGTVAVSGGAVRALNYMLSNCENSVISEFAKTNQLGTVVVVGIMVARAAGKYLDGEIDGAGFFDEIGQEGISLLGGMLASRTVMAMLGTGTLATGAGILAAMVVSAACSEIYAQAKKVMQFHKDNLEIQYIANSACAAIAVQQDDLRQLMDESHAEWVSRTTVIFQELADALADSDLQGTNSALRKIMSTMPGEVQLFESGDDLLRELLVCRGDGTGLPLPW